MHAVVLLYKPCLILEITQLGTCNTTSTTCALHVTFDTCTQRWRMFLEFCTLVLHFILIGLLFSDSIVFQFVIIIIPVYMFHDEIHSLF